MDFDIGPDVFVLPVVFISALLGLPGLLGHQLLLHLLHSLHQLQHHFYGLVSATLSRTALMPLLFILSFRLLCKLLLRLLIFGTLLRSVGLISCLTLLTMPVLLVNTLLSLVSFFLSWSLALILPWSLALILPESLALILPLWSSVACEFLWPLGLLDRLVRWCGVLPFTFLHQLHSETHVLFLNLPHEILHHTPLMI